VLSTQGPPGSNPARPLLFLADFLMRTIIYVDGFNLYFRLLVNRPAAKWLNIKTLSERLLDPANVVTGVKYYTARVSGRIDPTAPGRQQIYLDAVANRSISMPCEPCQRSQSIWGVSFYRRIRWPGQAP
jgi:hypothetical protein